MGKFDWSQWLYGLVAAFLGAGSGAVSSAFATMVTAPADFNLAHPAKLFETMAMMFFFSGVIAFFAKLHTSPLPSIVTTTETTTVQKQPPAIVKTTVVETTEGPK